MTGKPDNKNNNNSKDRLRREFLAIRKGLPEKVRLEKSLRMAEHLERWEVYRKAGVIHCFLSIRKSAEVETGPVFRQMFSDGKQVVVPRVLAGSNRLEHLLYSQGDPLKTHRLGIPEPVEGERVSPLELDLVLVPLLASDRMKNRLGYGMGYYDRFLSETDALKAGLLFSECLSAELLPFSPHDVRLDALITEEGIF